MSGGGKGGSQTTTVQIPEWLAQAAQRNIGRAENLSTIGPTPYYGPDVAALMPMQEAAMANTNAGAAAFGLAAPQGSGMPAPTTFAGGVQGYSSGSLYDQALRELAIRQPGQYAALRAPFIDPITGRAPTGVYGPPAAPPDPATVRQPTASSDTYRDRQETRALTGAMSRSNGGGGGGDWRSSQLASRLPGGVNTRNPSSVIKRTAAALSPKPTKAPTAKDRPVSRSTGGKKK